MPHEPDHPRDMSGADQPAEAASPGDAAVPRTETIEVAGLAERAEIRIDRWGIPHLRAGSKTDIFFTQGFNAARDRLWQIDLWRKRGLGLLAADFGPGYLEQDVAARAFLFRGDMTREWEAYGADARAICEAFVAGINAYVELTGREPRRLPDEFRRIGTVPARWAAEDVVRIRSHALTRNGLSEVLRACLLTEIDPGADLLRKNLEPRIVPGNAGGIDLSLVTPGVLDLFRLATAPVTFSPERLAATLEEAGRWRKIGPLADVVADADWTGSNNWAVAPARSATGRAIMASDPHRTHMLPSLRYLVHLTAPEFDVIGAGEPSVPGVSLGHNDTIAFSQTIFGSDQEDVYLYETRPGAPDQYRYADEWVAMDVVEEVFAVKGAPDQARRLRFTRHGPVLHADPGRDVAFALRSVWFEPGCAPYLAGLSSMRARDLKEFRAAIARFNAPSLNHLYADTSGNIAWLPFGMTPVRRNWDGLLPVPGDGRFEWDGFVGIDDMPMVVNPDCGYLYTANEANLPADWDHDAFRIGYEWLEKSRALRIGEVMEKEPRHSIAAAVALQTDVVSIPAGRLRHLLARLDVNGGDLARAVDLLLGWDGALHADSAAGALSEIWFTHHVKPALFRLFVPVAALRPLMEPGDVEGLLHALENPDPRYFGAAPEAARDRLLAATLLAAFQDAAARLGPDPASWQWGQLHHACFEHPLTPIAGEAWREASDVGPLPKGGSASTVMHAAYRPHDFRVTMGASVRMVLDVGNWDASLCINTPGQSGDRRSPHYRDLAPAWAEGSYVPFLYSREAVEAATSRLIVLIPPSEPKRPSANGFRGAAADAR